MSIDEEQATFRAFLGAAWVWPRDKLLDHLAAYQGEWARVLEVLIVEGYLREKMTITRGYVETKLAVMGRDHPEAILDDDNRARYHQWKADTRVQRFDESKNEALEYPLSCTYCEAPAKWQVVEARDSTGQVRLIRTACGFHKFELYDASPWNVEVEEVPPEEVKDAKFEDFTTQGGDA